MIYSLIFLGLAVTGGSPVSPSDFKIVGSAPPRKVMLSREDFNLIEKKPEPDVKIEAQSIKPVADLPPPPPPAPAEAAPVQYIQQAPAYYSSPYAAGSSCASGQCPTPTRGFRFFRR